MANTFKNVIYEVTDTLTDFYTCPAGTVAIVIGCQAANKDASNRSFTLVLDDGVDDEPLVYEVTIPSEAALAPIAGKLVLEAGDELKAEADDDNAISVVMSILEID